jgi:O-antigen ligase
LAVGLLAIDRQKIRQLGQLRGRPTFLILGLLVWVALSVPGALWQGGAFEVLTDDFIKTVVMFLVIAGSIRGPRDVERLAFVYFIGAAVFAVIVMIRFDPGKDGRLAGLYYYDANDFATWVVSALPLALYFIFGQRRLWWRIAACLAIGPMTVTFIRSGSRGGFIALIAVGLFFLFRYRSIATGWRVLGIVMGCVLFTAASSDVYWERMRTMLNSEQDYNRTSPQGRIQIWKRGIGYMLANPIVGVGAGNFGSAEGRLSPLARLQERGIGVKWMAPHNSYVQIGAELGIPGLLFFVGFLVAIYRALGRVERWDRTGTGAQRRLVHALMASLTGFVVGAFFLSLAYQVMLYALAALAVGLLKVTVRQGAPPQVVLP